MSSLPAPVEIAHRRALADHVVIQVQLRQKAAIGALQWVHVTRVSERGRGDGGDRHEQA